MLECVHYNEVEEAKKGVIVMFMWKGLVKRMKHKYVSFFKNIW